MKNLTIALAVVTIGYGGYYFYMQEKSSDGGGYDLISTEDAIANTQIFIERRAILDNTTVDTEIFSDPVFRSYKSFTKKIVDEEAGRANPFGRTIINGGT